MPNLTLVRRQLFSVVVRAVDDDMEGEIVAERGLTQEAAERAAERLNDLEAPFVATVRNMRWALVGAAHV